MTTDAIIAAGLQRSIRIGILSQMIRDLGHEYLLTELPE